MLIQNTFAHLLFYYKRQLAVPFTDTLPPSNLIKAQFRLSNSNGAPLNTLNTQSTTIVMLKDELTFEEVLKKTHAQLWLSGREIITGALADQFNGQQWQHFAKALHIAQWIDSLRYCNACGQAIVPPQAVNLALTHLGCAYCKKDHYPIIYPCVIGLVAQGPKLLLARHLRSEQPIYTLIAGFVEAGETFEQAFMREVNEECNLKIETPQYIASQPWPFPSQLMIGLQANYLSGEIKIDSTELIDAQFFSVDRLPLLPPKGTIARYLIDRFCTKILGN